MSEPTVEALLGADELLAIVTEIRNQASEDARASAVLAEVEAIIENATVAKRAIDASTYRALRALVTRDGYGLPEVAGSRTLSLDQAAHLCGVSRQTMASRAKRYELGICINGRWKIYESRLRMLSDRGPNGLASIPPISRPDDDLR